MNELSIFDLLPKEEAEQYKKKPATDWKWGFADYPEKNGIKVFSCFACGGGSTMGYKLAGCEVLGCCEIDEMMNKIYVNNHHPKYNFLMDIRDFNKTPNEELPDELFHLDILDGSPPCTTFSMSGDREKNWGKKKKFREGQAKQTLDDLSFIFINTARKLQPKMVVMENVEGLILGEAWSYVQRIYNEFKSAGYDLKHYLCKGEEMGIPQTRHRVFFIAARKDLRFDYNKLDMFFNYEPVTYSQIKTSTGKKIPKESPYFDIIQQASSDDGSIADTKERIGQKRSSFNNKYAKEDKILCTMRAQNGIIDIKEKAYISNSTIINAQTFPQDYNFNGGNIPYVCGMSVPPVMMKRIVERIIDTGVFTQCEQ